MRYLIISLVATTILMADFLTQKEYGEFLYNNPRGISCANCHGKKAEGKELVQYIYRKKLKEIKTNPITDIDFKTLKKALKKRVSIMPEYNLTDDEIKALVEFLKSSSSE